MVASNTEETEVQLVPAMFSPGTVLLGRYRVEEKLGAGGFGLVLRAHDLATDHVVAIKILRADIELDRENLERFLREARAIERLRSPHVVKLFDAGTLDDGAPYMVMELLDGEDLGTVLARAGKLPVALAASYVLQVCDALAEAHALGIIHRDIKPSNLFVTRFPDGAQLVKVLDFGISKAPAADGEVTLTQTASLLGTPAYMSPEQMRSAREVDARTDIWSLGAVLYELAEGRLPFAGKGFGELVVEASTQPHARMTAAPELAEIVGRCLAKEAGDRYANLAELAIELAPFAASDTARACAARVARTLGVVASPRAAAQPRPRRIRLAIVGGVAAAAIAAAAIGVAARGRAAAKPAPAAAAPIAVAPPSPAAPNAPAPAPAAAPTVAPPLPPPAPAVATPPAKRTAPAGHAKAKHARNCDPYGAVGGC